MVTTAEISAAIEQGITCKSVDVSSSDGVHFSLAVSSDEFNGLTRLDQHKLIYNCLSSYFGENWSELIHALEIKIIAKNK